MLAFLSDGEVKGSANLNIMSRLDFDRPPSRKLRYGLNGSLLSAGDATCLAATIYR